MTGRPADRAMYAGPLSALVRWFRVPTEPPTLDPGPDGTLESFRPDEGFLRYLRLGFGLVAALVATGTIIVWVLIAVAALPVGLLLLPLFVAALIVSAAAGWIALHLRFDTTWYVMTDRSLRIRRGIWVIRETTITFENVQNVKISEGPVQRLFGISSLVVETAGAGGETSGKGGATASAGVIEGVRDARRLRDLVLRRLRISGSAGLGDDDEPSDRGAWTPARLAMLRAIRDEATALASGR